MYLDSASAVEIILQYSSTQSIPPHPLSPHKKSSIFIVSCMSKLYIQLSDFVHSLFTSEMSIFISKL